MAGDRPDPESVSALREAEQSGLSFLATPGPGDSEGGEIYAPEVGSNPEQMPATKRLTP